MNFNAKQIHLINITNIVFLSLLSSAVLSKRVYVMNFWLSGKKGNYENINLHSAWENKYLYH